MFYTIISCSIHNFHTKFYTIKSLIYFQSQFQSHLATDRARTKEGSLWLAMNAIFNAYPDLEWYMIEPFLAPETPVTSCIPTLMAQ